MTHLPRFRRCAPAAGLAFVMLFAGCGDDAGPTLPVKPPPPACPAIDDFLHTVAIARPPGEVFGAAVSGDVVFAAGGTGGLHVLDISDPAEVLLFTTIPLTDARAVDVDGTMLYVAAGGDGLVVIDISSPSAPVVAGTADMPGCAVDVDVAGSRAYVANEDIGLVIVDVSVVSVPVIRGIENTLGKAVAVAAREPLAMVADELAGLRIVNVSDPAAPFVVKTVAVPGAARGVAVNGDIVAVAAREGGLQIVNARVPAFASIVGSLTIPRDAVSVAISANVAFVAEGSGGIEIIDISTPTTPVRRQIIGAVNIARDVAVMGDRLAIADDFAGVRVMSIATPVSPAVDSYLAGGDIQSVAVMGDLLVIADASFGLRVFDVGARTVIGEIAISAGPRDVAVVDSIAYVVTGAGVPVVDLRNPAFPVLLPALPVAGPFDGVAVAGEFAYLLASDGLLMEQRRDGTGIPRTYTDNGAYFPSLTIEDPFVYLPNRQGAVFAIVRSNMRLASIIPMTATAERVVFRRTDGPFGPVTRGWVVESGLTNGQAALEVYNFSDIIFPTLVQTVPCGGNAVDVAFAGTRMAVAQGDDGCEVFELGADGAARPIGYYPEPSLRVTAVGERFAVAAGTSGLLIISFDGCLATR